MQIPLTRCSKGEEEGEKEGGGEGGFNKLYYVIKYSNQLLPAGNGYRLACIDTGFTKEEDMLGVSCSLTGSAPFRGFIGELFISNPKGSVLLLRPPRQHL